MINIKALLNWLPSTPKLPWQDDHDPYHVWLTEIMLQQTTIATVANRFEQWLIIFPTLNSLAVASEHEVMRAWEGLGYYNRARNLHLCAQNVDRHGWPTSYEAMKKLPGIGDYTASALMSAFYNAPYLAIDANLKRIFMRQKAENSFNNNDKILWEKELLNDMATYGSHIINFAFIRLGQLICPVKNPSCMLCPLIKSCLAQQQGLSNLIAKPAKKAITMRQSIVLILLYNNKLWALQRTDGIGKGMFSLPRYGLEQLSMLEQRYGTAKIMPPVNHHYTRFNELLQPYLFTITDDKNSPLEGSWYSKEELDGLPFLSSYRLILNQIKWPVH